MAAAALASTAQPVLYTATCITRAGLPSDFIMGTKASFRPCNIVLCFIFSMGKLTGFIGSNALASASSYALAHGKLLVLLGAHTHAHA
jgi:hypothetical protein